MRGVEPFPPKEEIALQRSSVFNDTATFGNYIQHLPKCCYFMRFPTDWLTTCVRHVARGLGKCQDGRFLFRKFTRIPILLKITNRESAVSEFAEAAFFSFLFAIRGPSGALQLRRAYSSDNLLAFSPTPGKALIGIASVGCELFLVSKFAQRKNITNGCILRRPCFCNLGTDHAASLRPVRCFWPSVRRRVAPGQPLFRRINVGNFNRMLKAILAKLSVPDAMRFSSHGFRRGAAQELKDRGSPWALVSTAGLWNSPRFSMVRRHVHGRRDGRFPTVRGGP